MYQPQLGFSCCGRNDPPTEHTFASYAKHNAHLMEFSLRENVLFRCDFAAIKTYAEKSGVRIWSFHLPFWQNIDIASPNKEYRRQALLLDMAYIAAAGYLGAEYCVIHPSSEPIDDKNRAECLGYCKENLRFLADVAEKNGVVLAVENLPRTCLGNTPEELADIISCDSRLKVCFDVNHLLKCSHKHFIEVLGKEIVTTHMSDYDFVDERHALPGKGKINWKELLDLLEGIGYEGPFMYEVSMRAVSDTRADRLELPTFEDGYQNYRQVMERKF